MIVRGVSATLMAVVAAAGSTGATISRRHRLLLPTPPLPRSLTVDESEWLVVPSERVVGDGRVTFQVYDRGEDDHNLTVQGPITSAGPGRIRGQVPVKSGGMATLTANLPAGTYKLYCSLFAGTPQSHEMLGMVTEISVR